MRRRDSSLALIPSLSPAGPSSDRLAERRLGLVGVGVGSGASGADARGRGCGGGAPGGRREGLRSPPSGGRCRAAVPPASSLAVLLLRSAEIAFVGLRGAQKATGLSGTPGLPSGLQSASHVPGGPPPASVSAEWRVQRLSVLWRGASVAVGLALRLQPGDAAEGAAVPLRRAERPAQEDHETEAANLASADSEAEQKGPVPRPVPRRPRTRPRRQEGLRALRSGPPCHARRGRHGGDHPPDASVAQG